MVRLLVRPSARLAPSFAPTRRCLVLSRSLYPAAVRPYATRPPGTAPPSAVRRSASSAAPTLLRQFCATRPVRCCSIETGLAQPGPARPARPAWTGPSGPARPAWTGWSGPAGLGRPAWTDQARLARYAAEGSAARWASTPATLARPGLPGLGVRPRAARPSPASPDPATLIRLAACPGRAVSARCARGVAQCGWRGSMWPCPAAEHGAAARPSLASPIAAARSRRGQVRFEVARPVGQLGAARPSPASPVAAARSRRAQVRSDMARPVGQLGAAVRPSPVAIPGPARRGAVQRGPFRWGPAPAAHPGPVHPPVWPS